MFGRELSREGIGQRFTTPGVSEEAIKKVTG